MPKQPHGRAVIEMPNDLDVLTTREFEASIALVFDVLTKPEHVSKWFAPSVERRVRPTRARRSRSPTK